MAAMSFDFDSVSAPFRMQPGLRRVATGDRQLTAVHRDARHLAEKLQALRHHPADALLAVPGFDARPALQALIAQAVAEHPEACASTAPLSFEARWLNWSVAADHVAGDGPAEIGACLRALPAEWRLAALLALTFAEDCAVIDGATARIPWLAVCLPSRWAPEDKVGRHFAEVHAPVADNRVLVAAGEHLARLVTGTDRWARDVWSIVAAPDLMQHPRHAARVAWAPHADAATVAAHATFRTEHQTFIPVPESAQAVFTIRVETRPLADAIATPARALQLHAALASMSAAVLDYRGLTDVRERLLAWLADRAA